MRPSQLRHHLGRDNAFGIRFCCIYLSAVPPALLPLVHGSICSPWGEGRHRLMSGQPTRPRRRAQTRLSVDDIALLEEGLHNAVRRPFNQEYHAMARWGQEGKAGCSFAHATLGCCGHKCQPVPAKQGNSNTPSPSDTTLLSRWPGVDEKATNQPHTRRKSLHARRILINCLLRANMGFFPASLGVSLASLSRWLPTHTFQANAH